MCRRRSEARLAWVAISAVCWLGITHDVMAQAPRTMIVVTDASDVEIFRRIGDRLVDVEALLGNETSEYERCNDRVRKLRDFQFLCYREYAECSAGRFWRHRLTAANPRGETLCLSQVRPRTEVEQSVERAKAVHKALLAKFPNQRKQLDANLKLELHRLYLRKVAPLQLASAD